MKILIGVLVFASLLYSKNAYATWGELLEPGAETLDTASKLKDSLELILAIGSFVYNIGPRLYTKYIRARLLKQLLFKKDVVAVHIPSRTIEGRILPVVAREDYNTFEKLREILIKNAFEVNLKYIPPNGNIEADSSIANIVICGPKNSYKVKNTFDRYDKISFKEQKCGNESEWFFEIPDNGEKLKSPVSDSNNQYAFLGKLKLDPDNDNFSVILICGMILKSSGPL